MTQKPSTHNTLPSLSWTRADLLILGLITLVVAVVVQRLWQPGIPNDGDMLMSIYRVFELANAWRTGIFYPRLGPGLNFGYGAPLFQFYAPLASYIGLLFHWAGLGLIAATKATATLGLLLAALGMYGYTRALFTNRCAALVSALVYGLAPYLLLNVYERGAVAEGLALMILPWLFWSLWLLLTTGRLFHLWSAAGLVAAVMLAHNITALWAIPATGLYFVALAIYQRRWGGIIQVAVAFGLGLGLSAFYWLPALVEIKFTHTAVFMLQKPTEFAKNLVTWAEMIQPTLFFQYQGPLRFRFSLLQAILGTLGLLAIPWYKPKLRVQISWFAFVWLITLGLQLHTTLGIWQNAPMIRFLQFPWRLFGLATFCVAIMSGALFTWGRPRSLSSWSVALGVCALFIGANLQNLKPELLPFWSATTEAEINQLDLFTRGAKGYPLFSDYSPSSMQLDSKGFTLPRFPSFPPFPPLATPPAITVNAENPVYAHLDVQAPTPFVLRFARVFFPGWQVYMEDQPLPTYGSGPFGVVTADLPAGSYPVRIQFDQTPLRRSADWVSLVALGIWLVGGLAWRRPQTWVWRWGSVFLLCMGFVVYQQIRSRPTHHPTPYAVNFQDTIHLVGYDLPKTTWRATEAISLRLYWLVQQTPPSNYKIFLHLAQLDDSGQVAQADSEPLLGFTPMTNWEAGEVVTDEYLFHADNPIPPGRYRLLLGVYQPDPLQNLLVRSAPIVLPGDRVVLTEVEVVHE